MFPPIEVGIFHAKARKAAEIILIGNKAPLGTDVGFSNTGINATKSKT